MQKDGQFPAGVAEVSESVYPTGDRAGRQEKVPAHSLVYAWVVVLLLMVAYTFSFLDRQILALLVTDIKADLQVSDTQIGLLQGLAFTLFYTTLGIPIARLADHRNRRNLISLGILLWSIMTVACGYAKNFSMLFLARMGVGVGEAALSPAAYSIITDYFPRHHLSKALAVYALGVYIGGGIAFAAGGHLIDALAHADFSHIPLLSGLRSWQLAFIIAGLPGILVAAIIFLSVREPERVATGAQPVSAERVSLSAAVQYLRDHRKAYLPIYLGYSVQAIAIFATFAWLPSQLMRDFGWSVARAGQSVGLAVLILGGLGVFVGGFLCDRMLKAGRADAPMQVGVISSLGLGLSFVVASIFPFTPEIKMLVLGSAFFFMGLVAGPAPASIALIAPVRMRAQLSAIFLFSISFLGMTLGPLLPALLSDNFPDLISGIGSALMLVAILSGLLSAAIFYWFRSDYHRICEQECSGS